MSRNMVACGLDSAVATGMKRLGEEAVRLKPYSHDLGAQMFTSGSGIDHIVHAVLRWAAGRAGRAAAVYYFKVRSLRTGLTGIKQERSLLQSSRTF